MKNFSRETLLLMMKASGELVTQAIANNADELVYQELCENRLQITDLWHSTFTKETYISPCERHKTIEREKSNLEMIKG